jgi:proline iminopeptidase
MRNRSPIALRLMMAALCTAAAVGQEESVARDGFRLHYRTEGTGTPIVFLSGGSGLEVDYFVPAAVLFPAGYQRVYLEQRGTGRSRPAQLTKETMTLALMVSDVEALRTHLKQERLLLAGHSWGGMLAMAYAVAHPEHVDRLILIASGGPDLAFTEWFGANIESRLHDEDRAARAHWEAEASRGLDSDKAMLESLRAIVPAYFFDRATGLKWAGAMKDGDFNSEAHMLLFSELPTSYNLRGALPNLKRPVLILQGQQDPIGDRTAEDIRALIAGSKLRYINRCGHFPWVEQPEAMKAALAEFLPAQ